MISAERKEELYAIACEIFEALSGERYEPSERGAGWAPTEAGEEAVVSILQRAKARMWRDSPSEKRDFAIARRTWKAKKVAERLLGETFFVVRTCIHCEQFITREKGRLWRTSAGNYTCQARKNRIDNCWDHETIEV